MVSLTSAGLASGSVQSSSVFWLVMFSSSVGLSEAKGSLLALAVPLLVAVSFSVEFFRNYAVIGDGRTAGTGSAITRGGNGGSRGTR